MAISFRNKPSYPQRLFLWLLGYSLLMVGCFVVFQYHREKQFKVEELNARLQRINTDIIESISGGNGIDYVKDKYDAREIRISIINAIGDVVYDNSLDSLPKDNHLTRKEISEAMTNGEGYTLRRHSESTGSTYFYSAKKGGDYIVRSAVPYDVSLADLLKADYGFLWFTGGVALIMCVFGYCATQRVGLHLKRLSAFAERAERGEKIFDTEPFPHDELGNISNHIIRIYAQLQQAIFDRDREHRIALYEEQEKIRIKKQLTNNINHELKTPLASIQVCVETLSAHPDLPLDKREEFLARCASNVERLRQLLDDVSTITRMDDGSSVINKEPVNIRTIVADACAELSPKAENKGMVISNGVSQDVVITGNIALLSSVFHNLIDNAIAYSGGSSVDIRLVRNDDKGCVITLSDDGVGVEPQHLSRIFERFYRVDKGRSRQAGGTGLGLSIVKNAVLIHGGNISVENVPSGGLMFTIYLPKV